MILNTRLDIVDFKGSKLGDLTVGDTLANILGSTKSDDPAQSWRLGKRLATQDSVELTSQDLSILKSAVREYASMPGHSPLIAGQLLDLLASEV